jgi:uncharacterized membrane protein
MNNKTIIEKIENNNLGIVHAFCINILIMSFIYSILNINLFYSVVTLIGIFYFFSTMQLIINHNYQKMKNITLTIKK